MAVNPHSSILVERPGVASSHTFAFDTTGVGSNNAIGVGASYYSPGGDIVDSVTYNGDALAQDVIIEDGNNNAAEIWSLAGNDIGNHNVVVSLNFSGDPCITVISVDTVDQTTPVSNTATDTGTNVNAVVTSASGELAWDVCASYQESPAEDASQTEVSGSPGSTANVDGFSSFEASSGASVQMSWTVGSSSAQVVVSFQEAAPAVGGAVWPSPTKQMAHLLLR